MSDWKNKTALITGASYGIGEAFARRLATEGANLILTARSVDRLEAIADELRSAFNVAVTVIKSDLAQSSDWQKLFDQTEGRDQQVDLLINNAGFGAVGDFADLPLDRQLEMIQVNVTALVALSHLFVKPMLQRRSGAIIQLASTASFQGVPYFATYSATKSFILTFSEALWAECQPFGVRVLAVCPGPTGTHFQSVAGTENASRPVKMQTPDEVVQVSLKALAANRSVVVSGFGNSAMVFLERFVSRQTVTKMASKIYRPFSTRSGSK
ncbi:MAG TPA: SDR family oxidoreductase [Blastocatellia bacterium]|nr:SDR family oxidoreductase [Blastocatellia bacterium]